MRNGPWEFRVVSIDPKGREIAEFEVDNWVRLAQGMERDGFRVQVFDNHGVGALLYDTDRRQA